MMGFKQAPCTIRPCTRCHGDRQGRRTNHHAVATDRLREFKPANWRVDAARLNAILTLAGKRVCANKRRQLRSHLTDHHHHDGHLHCKMCMAALLVTQ